VSLAHWQCWLQLDQRLFIHECTAASYDLRAERVSETKLQKQLCGEAGQMLCRPAAGPGRPLIAIRWFDLQRVLLDCVAPSTVELGRRFVSASQNEEGGVRVDLEVCVAGSGRGEPGLCINRLPVKQAYLLIAAAEALKRTCLPTAHKQATARPLLWQAGAPVAARLLVGADGNASAVWEHLFPEAPLRYTGVSVWRTVIPKPPDWFELGTAVTWEGGRCPALADLGALSDLDRLGQDMVAVAVMRHAVGCVAGLRDCRRPPRERTSNRRGCCAQATGPSCSRAGACACPVNCVCAVEGTLPFQSRAAHYAQRCCCRAM